MRRAADGRRCICLADWPGHDPNAAAVVQILAAAGADLDAPAVAMWHRETPLHWAASSDDVALIDALLDAGADLEHEGSSIDGASSLSSAVGYGQWAAARRLVDRGARTQLWHEAALGMMPEINRRLAAATLPAEQLSGPFWNACHGGQLAVAEVLLAHGADLNWPAPWSGQTPLDIAEQAECREVVAWLLERGAMRASKNTACRADPERLCRKSDAAFAVTMQIAAEVWQRAVTFGLLHRGADG